jgi:hypothetical protein
LKRWKKILSYCLKNHVGTVDEAGTLQLSKQPTTHPTLYDFINSVGNPRNARSERQKDTNPSEVRYTPLVPTDNKQGKRNPQEVQKTSMHDQIASTMKLAGALYEVSTMLNEEISNTASQKGDDISLNQTNSDMVNEANPVFETMKNGEIDIEAVQEAMAELKARLHDHKDKSQVLARVCRRWKEELETRYPLMKRNSAPRKSIDNTMSPRSGSPRLVDPATKTHTLGKSDKRESSEKARYTPLSLQSQTQKTERSKSISAMTLDNPEEGSQPSGQQGKINDERDRKPPRSRSSNSRQGGHDKDDGFSIFAL